MFITGATGNIGQQLITICEKAGVRCIAAGRRNLWEGSNGVEHRHFDFEKPETFGAVAGVKTVFLVRPPHISNIKKGIGPFLERCKSEGVEHIVFLSVVGVETLSFVPHYKIEKKIESLGLRYSFVRAGFFMQNLSTTHLEEIRDRNEIVVPCGNGRTTFVHTRDIAQVCFQLITGNLVQDKIDVVGNDTLSYFEVAQLLCEATGKKITYKPVSPFRFLLYRWGHGTPFKFALVMIGIYMPTKIGKAEIHGVDITPILGRPPIPFKEFCTETAPLFKPQPPSIVTA